MDLQITIPQTICRLLARQTNLRRKWTNLQIWNSWQNRTSTFFVRPLTSSKRWTPQTRTQSSSTMWTTSRPRSALTLHHSMPMIFTRSPRQPADPNLNDLPPIKMDEIVVQSLGVPPDSHNAKKADHSFLGSKVEEGLLVEIIRPKIELQAAMEAPMDNIWAAGP